MPALQRTLFTPGGARRLPAQRALDRALAAVGREQLFRFCETRPHGPLYVLPTREFIQALATRLRALAGRRGNILEVCAGDGFLTDSLRQADSRLRVTATDSGRWERAAARMTTAEGRAQGASVSGLRLGPRVVRREAVAAICALRPDVVLAAWLPPGKLFDRLVRAPCRFLVEIGADGGVSGQGEWGWRFAHAFEPELERLARSRLDARGDRRTRVTVYFGRRHPGFAEEKPSRGDWLRQFKP